ncbi:MAG: HNH endonuclease [Actinomycetia bacterium]|nr:HNH endonuclease [Actinomycetes bacterium]
MAASLLDTATQRVTDSLHELAATTRTAPDDDLLSALLVCEGLTRRVDAICTAAIGDLDDRGVFLQHGYRSVARALADLLGWDYVPARTRAALAAAVHSRTTLTGEQLPAQLPATAAAFSAGDIALRHVEVIAKVLATDAGRRLPPEVQLAEHACVASPSDLLAFGTELITLLDQDGPGPDDTPPPVNELRLTRHRSGAGGSIKGRFEDPALYDAIAAVIDAKAKPLTADDDRTAPQRQAEALADVCGHVLNHDDQLPETGGRRPQVTVIVRLEDLERRARAAMLEFGGTLSPASLRMLACDANVIPVVMGGNGQPLDVGLSTRVIPDGLRRAVTARDQGCAHPGCDRPPSWCDIHHVDFWGHHGPTEIDNLVMLCKAHHRQVHHTEWTVRIRDGLPEFVPPKWIDPRQVPRRKVHPHLAA